MIEIDCDLALGTGHYSVVHDNNVQWAMTMTVRNCCQLSEDLHCLTCPTNNLELVALFASTKCALFSALFTASVLALFFALVLRLAC